MIADMKARRDFLKMLGLSVPASIVGTTPDHTYIIKGGKRMPTPSEVYEIYVSTCLQMLPQHWHAKNNPSSNIRAMVQAQGYALAMTHAAIVNGVPHDEH